MSKKIKDKVELEKMIDKCLHEDIPLSIIIDEYIPTNATYF